MERNSVEFQSFLFMRTRSSWRKFVEEDIRDSRATVVKMARKACAEVVIKCLA